MSNILGMQNKHFYPAAIGLSIAAASGARFLKRSADKKTIAEEIKEPVKEKDFSNPGFFTAAGMYAEGPETVRELKDNVSYLNDVNMSNLSDMTKNLIFAGLILGVGLIAIKGSRMVKIPKV